MTLSVTLNIIKTPGLYFPLIHHPFPSPSTVASEQDGFCYFNVNIAVPKESDIFISNHSSTRVSFQVLYITVFRKFSTEKGSCLLNLMTGHSTD